MCVLIGLLKFCFNFNWAELAPSWQVRNPSCYIIFDKPHLSLASIRLDVHKDFTHWSVYLSLKNVYPLLYEFRCLFTTRDTLLSCLHIANKLPLQTIYFHTPGQVEVKTVVNLISTYMYMGTFFHRTYHGT